jgi:hypothetical protein
VNTAYPMSQLLSWDFACTETTRAAAYSAYSPPGENENDQARVGSKHPSSRNADLGTRERNVVSTLLEMCL